VSIKPKALMRSDLLVWIDLEMTGLEPSNNRIIEIATVITDAELNLVATGPCIVVHQPESELVKMDEWNIEHHTANGLIERVRESEVSEREAEGLTLEFLRQNCNVGEVLLCGNTIGQDRRFLNAQMPELHKCFHYRSIDVSTVKELVKRWYPNAPPYQKKCGHRALDDILESIAELRHYRETVFKNPE